MPLADSIWLTMLNQTLSFVVLFAFPGALVTAFLLRDASWGRVQWVALSAGVGICAGVIVGQIAVLFPLPPLMFGVVYIAFVTVLAVVGWWRSGKWRPKTGHLLFGTDGRVFSGMLALVLLSGFVWLLFRYTSHIVPYVSSPTDVWHYAQVQIQFIENPTDMNIQAGMTAPGTNRRLLWNGWLYIQAVWNELARGELIESTRRSMLFALGIASLLVWVALGRELFQSRGAAWVTGLVHAAIVIGDQGKYWLRLSEDKFLSYYMLLPLTYILLLRLLKQWDRRVFILYAVVTLGVTLVHPINAVLIAMTSLPIVVVWYGFQKRWYIIAIFVVWCAFLFAHPLFLQTQLTADTFVEDGMAFVRDIPWTFSQPLTLFAGRTTPAYIYAIPILPLLLLSIILEPNKRLPALFLLILTLTVAFSLYVPPFSALVTKVVTLVQSWRLFMLFPIGFIWGWLFWQASQLAFKRWAQVPGIVLCAVTMAFALNWIDHWRYNRWHDDEIVSDEIIQGFADVKETIGDERVLTTEYLSLMFPTLVPDGRLAFWRTGVLQPQAYDDLNAAMSLGTDPSAAVAKHDIRYVLLPHDVPLVEAINFELPCCVKLYENEALNLYEWVYPLHRGEMQQETSITFGNFATLYGYGTYKQDDELFVTLFWAPRRQTPEPYTVFVHLLQDGALFAQDDHPPRLGQIGTYNWQLGQRYPDMFRLDLSDVPSGTYEIHAGLYNPQTLERVATEEGLEAVILAEIEITADD